MADVYNLSNYLESGIYDHLLRSPTFAKPTLLAFALCSGIPNSANTGANIPEIPNSQGYARVNYGAPANSGWQIHATDTGGANMLPIQWPTVTGGNWPMVSGLAILDSATFGAGNLLFWGAFTTPRQPLIGDAPIMNSGACVLVLD